MVSSDSGLELIGPPDEVHNQSQEELIRFDIDPSFIELVRRGFTDEGVERPCFQPVLDLIDDAHPKKPRTEELLEKLSPLQCKLFIDLIDFVLTKDAARPYLETQYPDQPQRAVPEVRFYERQYDAEELGPQGQIQEIPNEHEDLLVVFGYPIVESNPLAVANGCWVRFTNPQE